MNIYHLLNGHYTPTIASCSFGRQASLDHYHQLHILKPDQIHHHQHKSLWGCLILVCARLSTSLPSERFLFDLSRHEFMLAFTVADNSLSDAKAKQLLG